MEQLQKASIVATYSDRVHGASCDVQFNPTEFSLDKGAQIAEIAIPGLDSPLLQFVRGQAEKLTVDLFFDTTENGTGAGATSVTTVTDQVYQLVKIEPDGHAPPSARSSGTRGSPARTCRPSPATSGARRSSAWSRASSRSSRSSAPKASRCGRRCRWRCASTRRSTNSSIS